MLLVSVTTIYVPNYNNRQPNNNISATSYYAIWANKGDWKQVATANCKQRGQVPEHLGYARSS